MEGLKVFQLELETVEKKKDELDAIVARAPGWQFPLDGDRIMILDESKTKRTGWLGHKLGMMFADSPIQLAWQSSNSLSSISFKNVRESSFRGEGETDRG